MLPHTQESAANIEPCIPCGEKQDSHTETGAEKRCNRQKQPPPVAVLWKI